MELNPDKDIQIEVTRLGEEFQVLPLLIYRYSEAKSDAGYAVDVAEAEYKEMRADVFKEILSEHEKKPSDKVIEAEIESHPKVKKAKRNYLSTKRDYETIKGFVESLRAKKDMLIQLGADARKE